MVIMMIIIIINIIIIAIIIITIIKITIIIITIIIIIIMCNEGTKLAKAVFSGDLRFHFLGNLVT